MKDEPALLDIQSFHEAMKAYHATAAQRVHVSPRRGKWAVRREGSSREYQLFDDKREAIAAARRYGARVGAITVVVHRSDGGLEQQVPTGSLAG